MPYVKNLRLDMPYLLLDPVNSGPDCLLAPLSLVGSDQTYRMYMIQAQKGGESSVIAHLVSLATFLKISIRNQKRIINLNEPE